MGGGIVMTRDEAKTRIHRVMPPVVSEDWPNVPVDRAEGPWLESGDRRIADMMAGFAVVNAGHNHPGVIAAAREQMDRVVHAPAGVMVAEPQLALAEALARILPGDLDTVWFGNSGAEAIDAALKLARYSTGRFRFVSFYGSFHGRTLGATAVTGSRAGHRRGYGPLLPGVSFVPYPNCFRCPWGRRARDCSLECLDAVSEHFARVVPPEEVAAIIIEPVQGEGGFIPVPTKFLDGLRRMCDEHGILLIFDEIQTGFGRTGRMFAADTLGVKPDLICLAKAMASGFPISALAGPRSIMGGWAVGAHGTTFGGNAISAAAGLATLEVLEAEELPARAAALGARVLEKVGSWPERFARVGDVRGLGLMIGIEYVEPETGAPDGEAARIVLEGALERGFLFVPAGAEGQVVRLTPPLNVPEDLLWEAVDVLEDLTSGI